MIALHIQAPFAVFRNFTAGWYRPTASFLTPSAAYGLILNLAGLESRRDDGQAIMTLTAFDLPPALIAIGADPDNPHGPFPATQSIFQQLHNYPVGSSGKERKDDTKGNKYNITPVRREFLASFRAYILLRSTPELESRVRQGVLGSLDTARYGLPFLGDNSFLIDKIKVIDDAPILAHWYSRIGLDDETEIRPHTTRLTCWVDREEMSKTQVGLFAPTMEAIPIESMPESVWTSINPPASPQQSAKEPAKTRTGQKKQRETMAQPLEIPEFHLKREANPNSHQKGLFDE
jgi:CRISPR-associated protein Cas5t